MDDDHDLTAVLRKMQIITVALILGASMFAGLAWVMVVVMEIAAGGDAGGMLGLIGVILGLGQFAASFIVPGKVSAQRLTALTSRSTADLAALFQAQHIMQVGLLEGAAFFNLVTYMAGGMWWSLAFALGLILWILMLFPTRTRLRHWIETRRLTDM